MHTWIQGLTYNTAHVACIQRSVTGPRISWIHYGWQIELAADTISRQNDTFKYDRNIVFMSQKHWYASTRLFGITSQNNSLYSTPWQQKIAVRCGSSIPWFFFFFVLQLAETGDISVYYYYLSSIAVAWERNLCEWCNICFHRWFRTGGPRTRSGTSVCVD